MVERQRGRLIGLDQREGRARHVAFDAKRPQNCPRQRGFACSQLALEQHGVARLQLSRDTRPQCRSCGFVLKPHGRLESRHSSLVACAFAPLNALGRFPTKVGSVSACKTRQTKLRQGPCEPISPVICPIAPALFACYRPCPINKAVIGWIKLSSSARARQPRRPWRVCALKATRARSRSLAMSLLRLTSGRPCPRPTSPASSPANDYF